MPPQAALPRRDPHMDTVSAQSVSPSPAPTPPTKSLLIVDDEKSVRETLRLLLERRGFQIHTADNGAAGLALAAAHVVDGAMVDVHMHGMDGVTLCRALREQAAASGRDLAVWLMSGARSSDVIKAGAEAGARAVLGKPFNLAQLYEMLESQLNPPAVPRG